ncbi:hypothetical protein Goe21_01890 [Bacillus phage vB_BsuM-Goe21]|nr:hypothetical protein Goe21_01890 [Bacillus phage vB_BsuM-Goe21]
MKKKIINTLEMYGYKNIKWDKNNGYTFDGNYRFAELAHDINKGFYINTTSGHININESEEYIEQLKKVALFAKTLNEMDKIELDPNYCLLIDSHFDDPHVAFLTGAILFKPNVVDINKTFRDAWTAIGSSFASPEDQYEILRNRKNTIDDMMELAGCRDEEDKKYFLEHHPNGYGTLDEISNEVLFVDKVITISYQPYDEQILKDRFSYNIINGKNVDDYVREIKVHPSNDMEGKNMTLILLYDDLNDGAVYHAWLTATKDEMYTHIDKMFHHFLERHKSSYSYTISSISNIKFSDKKINEIKSMFLEGIQDKIIRETIHQFKDHLEFNEDTYQKIDNLFIYDRDGGYSNMAEVFTNESSDKL